jgi:hypothetical protein
MMGNTTLFHWRENLIDPGYNLFIGKIYAGNARNIGPEFPLLPLPWQAWRIGGGQIGCMQVGHVVGYFETASEARDALINDVIEAMIGEPDAKP